MLISSLKSFFFSKFENKFEVNLVRQSWKQMQRQNFTYEFSQGPKVSFVVIETVFNSIMDKKLNKNEIDYSSVLLTYNKSCKVTGAIPK